MTPDGVGKGDIPRPPEVDSSHHGKTHKSFFATEC
jgi:hypothetical protein